jgi:hypothetical protein
VVPTTRTAERDGEVGERPQADHGYRHVVEGVRAVIVA